MWLYVHTFITELHNITYLNESMDKASMTFEIRNNFWIDRYWKNEYHLRRLDSRFQIHAYKKYNKSHASHMSDVAFLHRLYSRDINYIWNKNDFWINLYLKKWISFALRRLNCRSMQIRNILRAICLLMLFCMDSMVETLMMFEIKMIFE